MEVPDLVRARLGDEEVTAGVSIGDEDAVCLTPTRTLVYRGEGILSDEHVEEFSHDIERLSIKEGRRKTKFVLEYVEGPETFTVPSDRGETVLELLLQGVLRHAGTIDRRESIAGVYRFTELTLVVTDSRLLKHIGNRVWDDDFEGYHFESVTGLDFERASNATSVAIEVSGRPQRVKIPNDTARVVRQTIENALFDYYDVDSLDAFNATVGVADEGPDAGATPDAPASSKDIGFEDGIDPLVTDSEADVDDVPEPSSSPDVEAGDSAVPDRMDVTPTRSRSETDSSASDDAAVRVDDPTPTGDPDADSPADGDRSETEDPSARPAAGDTSPGDESGGTDPGRRRTRPSGPESTGGTGEASDAAEAGDQQSAAEASDQQSVATTDDQRGAAKADDGDARERARTMDYEPASRDDLAAVTAQVEDLTDAVERQNELLRRQHEAIKQLVSELHSE